MKKIHFLLLVFATLAACKKTSSNAPGSSSNNKLAGKWDFISVTTVFRDTTGTVLGGQTYPNPPGSYYQFNNDGTWGSKFLADTSLGLNNRGFYGTITDTAFNLSDTGKFAYSERCKIYTLTPSLLQFSHTKNTVFNGVTPGTEEYVFKLTR